MKLSLILIPSEMIADDDDEDDGVATHVNPKCQAACQPRVQCLQGPSLPGISGSQSHVIFKTLRTCAALTPFSNFAGTTCGSLW